MERVRVRAPNTERQNCILLERQWRNIMSSYIKGVILSLQYSRGARSGAVIYFVPKLWTFRYKREIRNIWRWYYYQRKEKECKEGWTGKIRWMQKNYYSSTNSCYLTMWGMVLNHCERDIKTKPKTKSQICGITFHFGTMVNYNSAL